VETLPVRYASQRYRFFRAASAVAVGLLVSVILALTAPLTTIDLGILTATWALVGWQAIRGARLCLEVRVDSVMVRNPLRTWYIPKAAIRAADGDGRALVLPGMRGGARHGDGVHQPPLLGASLPDRGCRYGVVGPAASGCCASAPTEHRKAKPLIMPRRRAVLTRLVAIDPEIGVLQLWSVDTVAEWTRPLFPSDGGRPSRA
jgi:hypothetical protein